MQKIIYTIILVFIFSSLFSQAKKNERRFEIKTNLLNLAAAGPSAGLEYWLKNNNSFMVSLASGHIDYADFGGITRYKTATVEFRKYSYYSSGLGLFFGPYIKNTQKKVEWQKYVVAGVIPIGRDRDFTGNGISAGLSAGIKVQISNRVHLEFNTQFGYGRYYRMADGYNNLPTGNYLDTRMGLWLGFQF